MYVRSIVRLAVDKHACCCPLLVSIQGLARFNDLPAFWQYFSFSSRTLFATHCISIILPSCGSTVGFCRTKFVVQSWSTFTKRPIFLIKTPPLFHVSYLECTICWLLADKVIHACAIPPISLPLPDYPRPAGSYTILSMIQSSGT